jgi:hypothetical protein
MPFPIFSGFGATPPVNLTAGTGDVMAVAIYAPSSGVIVVDKIIATALQNAGVFKTPAYIAIYVMRGPKGAEKAMFTPASTDLVGMPTQKQMADAGLQLLLTSYINVQSQCTPLDMDPGLLSARDGQTLLICSPGVVDGSTNAPALLGGPVSLTVLGHDDTETVRVKLR